MDNQSIKDAWILLMLFACFAFIYWICVAMYVCVRSVFFGGMIWNTDKKINKYKKQ